MRIRKKRNVNEKIKNFADIVIPGDVEVGSEYRGHWRELFNKSTSAEQKLYIELGTGKGDFITQLAELNPEIYFVGFEMETTVVYAAARKIRERNLTNVRLVVFDINNIDEIFNDNEVDRIYINFCDPWPKKRHAKRRLTHVRFLDKYRRILNPEGIIQFKTDNRGLFDFSLEQFELANAKVNEISYDLHAENPTDNIETEYEKKFSSLGVPICRCLIRF